MLKGVISVTPGYSGGHVSNPTYEQVSNGVTGHVECTRIIFDPTLITYVRLLEVFFATHDPTIVDRQGHDIGTQYNSVVFYLNETQKNQADEIIARLNSQTGGSIVTRVEPFKEFFEAEDYHRHYFENHRDSRYCELVIEPKLDEVKRRFGENLK